MKLYKILMMALAVLGLSACSDDNDTNTAGNVTVCMEQAEISVRESRGIFNIPVKLTGEPNGPVRVTVKVEEVAPSPAMADVHYLVTSQNITISADNKSGYIEIKTVDNTEENEARVFNVTIESAEGATIGTPATTTVTIKDDDSDPYIKLCGTWTFTALDPWEDTEISYTLKMETPPADDDYYGKELYAYGLEGESILYLPFTYKGNEETGEFSLTVDYGQFMTTSILNFGFKGVLVSMGEVDGKLSTSGKLNCEVNSDMTEITFNPNDILYGGVFTYPDMEYKGLYTGFYSMKLVKVQ